MVEKGGYNWTISSAYISIIQRKNNGYHSIERQQNGYDQLYKH